MGLHFERLPGGISIYLNKDVEREEHLPGRNICKLCGRESIFFVIQGGREKLCPRCAHPPQPDKPISPLTWPQQIEQGIKKLGDFIATL
jgi:hypothetical protein